MSLTWIELAGFATAATAINIGLAWTWYWRPPFLNGHHAFMGWTLATAGLLILLTLIANRRHPIFEATRDLDE